MKIWIPRILLAFHLFVRLMEGKASEVQWSEDSKCRKQSSMANGHNIITRCIFSKILIDYDNRIRPNFGGGNIVVNVDILLANILGVSEVKNEFTVEIYLRQYWNDARLNFETFNVTDPLFLNSEMIRNIWVPSTYFKKSKRATLHDITTDNLLMRIDRNGDVFYSQRLSVTSSCVLDLRYFPHDSQVCELTIESYAYQEKDLVYNWNLWNHSSTQSVQTSDIERFDLPSFELIKITQKKGFNAYSIGRHSYLVSVFNFKRRIGYFLIETYVPSVIIVVISWVSFWISANSAPARVSLGITTVLTMTTISSSARESLPKVSYVKAIDWFLLVCLVFVFAALIEFAIVAYSHDKMTKKMLQMKKMRSVSRSDNEDDVASAESEQEYNVDRSRVRTPYHSWSVTFELKQNKPNKSGAGCYGIRKKLMSDTLLLPATIDNYSRRGFPIAFLIFHFCYWLNIWMYTA